MENKHTPGPWVMKQTSASNGLSIYGDNGNKYIGIFSANVVRPALMKENNIVVKANTALISAAPELLEALQIVFAKSLELPEFSVFNREEIKLIASAIAKATTI